MPVQQQQQQQQQQTEQPPWPLLTKQPGAQLPAAIATTQVQPLVLLQVQPQMQTSILQAPQQLQQQASQMSGQLLQLQQQMHKLHQQAQLQQQQAQQGLQDQWVHGNSAQPKAKKESGRIRQRRAKAIQAQLQQQQGQQELQDQ